jgi:hypothetical protein
MNIPADQSQCPRCKKGIIRRHSAGATCKYCGRTWLNKSVLLEFKDLENGEMFIFPEYYPDSVTYNSKDTEQIVWVKAQNDTDFPKGRNHWRDNAYRADKPYLCASAGPLVYVIPIKPLEKILRGTV